MVPVMCPVKVPRRSYGDGGISFDETAGLWVGTVDLAPLDGKRRRVKRKAKTKAALAAKLREVQRTRDDGLPVVDQQATTGAWLTFWVDKVLPGTVAASTEGQYRQTVKDWIVPYVGTVPLAKLRPEHVVDMMRSLEAKGLSPTTQRKARTILRRALGQAERFGRVTRNVAALTDAPKDGGSKVDDALDAESAVQVLDAARGDRLEALAVLVLAVGVRKSEALDLRWADLDLDAATVTVIKSKTDAGVRRIGLPPFAVTALRQHRAAQAAEQLAAWRWDDPGLVFTTTVGTRIHGRNALRWWHDLTIRAGVGRRRFHASRHTAATLMLNNGVSLEVVSATLGHAGLAITSDIYAKVRPELQRTAATAMDRVLGGAQ